MARTEISPETAATTGLNATYTAAIGDGHSVKFDAKTVLHFKNDSGGSVTITLQTPRTVDGLAVTDRTVAIPAGQARFIRGLTADYRQADDLVYIDYSATASVSVAIFN